MKHSLHHWMVEILIALMGVVCFQSFGYAGTWNLTIKQTDSVDYCSSSRDVIIEFSVDADIYFADSIYGFDFEFEYDPKKLVLFQNLEAGTLYGKIAQNGFKKVDFSTPGFVFVSCSNFSLTGTARAIAGSRVFTRIAGRLIGECDDSTYVLMQSFEVDSDKQHDFNMRYFPFGYKVALNRRSSSVKEINYAVSQGIMRVDTVERKMKFVTPVSHTDKNREKVIQTELRFSELYQGIVDTVILEKSSTNIEILNILSSDSLYSVKYRLKSGALNESIGFSIALRDTIMNIDSLPMIMEVSTKELSTCTCTKLDKKDLLKYLWIREKDTVVNTISDIDNYGELVTIERQNGKIRLSSNGTSSVNIRVYTIEGQLVTEIKRLSTADILQEYDNGLYLIVVENTVVDSSDQSRFQLIKIYK